MKFRFIGLVSVLLLAAAVAYSQSNPPTVRGSIANGTVTRGQVARATVVLSIPGGLHVNSNRPNSEYQIPTTVRVSAKSVRVGPVSYPRGKNRKFSFSESTINIYDGRVSFGFNVTVPESFKGDRLSLRVTVKYQACTDEVCYPPKNKAITLTARVQ